MNRGPARWTRPSRSVDHRGDLSDRPLRADGVLEPCGHVRREHVRHGRFMTWTLAVALLGDPLPGRSPPELRVPINAAASRLGLPLGHPVLGTLRADPGDTHEAGSQASSAGDVDPFRIGALGHGARVARLGAPDPAALDPFRVGGGPRISPGAWALGPLWAGWAAGRVDPVRGRRLAVIYVTP